MTFQRLSRVAGAEHSVCSCSDRADLLVKMYVDFVFFIDNNNNNK